MAEKIGQKNPRSLPKNPPDPRTAAKEAVLGEGLGITANSPSELANALSIGLLAVKDIAIQQGDRFAIEWSLNDQWVFESHVIQFRNGYRLSKVLLPKMHDYRSRQWTPIDNSEPGNLRITLARHPVTVEYSWDPTYADPLNPVFSIPKRNLDTFQATINQFAQKIAVHCASRERVRKLSESCQIHADDWLVRVITPKFILSEIMPSLFAKKSYIEGLGRLMSLVEFTSAHSPHKNNGEARENTATMIRFLRSSVASGIIEQQLLANIKKGDDAYVASELR